MKAALGEDAFVEVHPEDAEKQGLANGGRAVGRTDAGEAILPVRVTEHIAHGACSFRSTSPACANGLLSGSFTTSARIEAAVAEAEPAVRAPRGPPDGLARLAAAGRALRSCSSPC